MESGLRTAIPRDSAAEVQVHVFGDALEEVIKPSLIVDVGALRDPPLALRLTDILYSVQSGLTVFLWWDEGESKRSLILPLEGRGRLDLSPTLGITNPKNEGWTGHVTLTTEHATIGEGRKSFFLGLEFSKVRN